MLLVAHGSILRVWGGRGRAVTYHNNANVRVCTYVSYEAGKESAGTVCFVEAATTKVCTRSSSATSRSIPHS